MTWRLGERASANLSEFKVIIRKEAIKQVKQVHLAQLPSLSHVSHPGPRWETSVFTSLQSAINVYTFSSLFGSARPSCTMSRPKMVDWVPNLQSKLVDGSIAQSHKIKSFPNSQPNKQKKYLLLDSATQYHNSNTKLLDFSVRPSLRLWRWQFSQTSLRSQLIAASEKIWLKCLEMKISPLKSHFYEFQRIKLAS
jgi:hypothetical protein